MLIPFNWKMAIGFISPSIPLRYTSINTYNIIIDKSMIGNVLNTNFEESSSFFPYFVYLIFFGVFPSILLFKVKIISVKLKNFLIHISLALVSALLIAYANGTNWLWIDKHSKTLGALVMSILYS